MAPTARLYTIRASVVIQAFCAAQAVVQVEVKRLNEQVKEILIDSLTLLGFN